MDNYVKGEEKDAECVIPFDSDLILNVPVLKVKSNVRVHNLCGYAEKILSSETCRRIIFVGVGAACTKTISCAEVLKRRLKFTLHQISRVQFKRIEEFWEPLEKGLDRLKVNRDIPSMYILLSKDPFNQLEDPSYQLPGEYSVPFCEQRKFVARQQKQQRKKSDSHVASGSSERRRENIWKRPAKKERTKTT